jgi:hypothetical protein
VTAGRRWECTTIALQSTAMAFDIYQSMGFTTVVRYAAFVKAA